MRLQYFTSVYTDTDEVRQLLKNKREVEVFPFETELEGKYYKSFTPTGEEAYLVIEEDKYLNVFV